MTTLLFALGGLKLIASVIIGIMTERFLGFILCLVAGISSAAIFFALAIILNNQEKIMQMLNSESTQKRKLLPQKQCEKCEKMHDGDMTSCPHCGHKTGNKLPRHG